MPYTKRESLFFTKYYPLHEEGNIKLGRTEIKWKIIKASMKIAQIRKEGYAKREDILKDQARHEARRQGKETIEPVWIPAMLNVEK